MPCAAQRGEEKEEEGLMRKETIVACCSSNKKGSRPQEMATTLKHKNEETKGLKPKAHLH
jgi:hypothetical protein